MQELSSTSKMRLYYNHVDSVIRLRNHDDRLNDLHAKQLDDDTRMLRQKVTTAEELHKMLQLHIKNSSPIDIWV